MCREVEFRNGESKTGALKVDAKVLRVAIIPFQQILVPLAGDVVQEKNGVELSATQSQ